MHREAFEFVRRVAQALPPLHRVVEFGSKIHNGSVREIFTDAFDYLGIDLEAGPGVDWVADAADWRAKEPFDCVVCCEVMEHTPKLVGILAAAYAALRPGGVLILTCATAPREPHGACGGSLQAGEYYRNVSPDDMFQALKVVGFTVALLDHFAPVGDLHILAMVAR